MVSVQSDSPSGTNLFWTEDDTAKMSDTDGDITIYYGIKLACMLVFSYIWSLGAFVPFRYICVYIYICVYVFDLIVLSICRCLMR